MEIVVFNNSLIIYDEICNELSAQYGKAGEIA